MANRTRKTLAGFGILAITSSLVLTGCGDTGCDSMGNQQRSLQEIALAGSSTEADNFVELPNATAVPNFGSQSFVLQANTQADGDTQVLADDCGGDDGDD